jgi:hypothetical protein
MLAEDKFSVEDVRGYFSNRFEGTAFFRSERALEYPDDTRNHEACALCMRYAAEVDGVEKNILEIFRDRYPKLYLDEASIFEFDALADELFRGIGFQSAWPRASDYVEYLTQEMDRLLARGLKQQRN